MFILVFHYLVKYSVDKSKDLVSKYFPYLNMFKGYLKTVFITQFSLCIALNPLSPGGGGPKDPLLSKSLNALK